MKHLILYLSLLSCLLVTSCAKNSSNLSPTQPGGNQGNTTPIDPPATNPTDPYGTQIRASVPIDLADKINYSGLADISGSGGNPGNLRLPLVGDARVRLQTSSTRSQSIDGSLFLSFEDQFGFWAAQWDKAFPGTGIQVTSSGNPYLDIIFADDDLVVRAIGTTSSNIFYGTLYYRLRQSGDTACRQVTQTCTSTWNGTTFTVPCPPQYTYDSVTPCRNYMNPSNSQVKRLGNFSNDFSKITTFTGAN